MSGRLLIVQVGTTVPGVRARRGDFGEWFARGLGGDPEVRRPHLGEELPPAAGLAGAVVTGSSAMVTDRAPWSEATARWLRAAVEDGLPVLGVCYGHQLLAHAFGGTVGWNPTGREIGTVEVELLPGGVSDPLFAGLCAALTVQTTHSQSVLELPPGARLLATNPSDAHQAFALGPAAWGVQFHPEFDADILRGYVEERGDELEVEELDTAALLAGLRDSGDGARILANFAGLAGGR